MRTTMKTRSKEEQTEIVRRALSISAEAQPADLTQGRIIAVEICSDILEVHVWLAFDDSFDPKDGQAVFYAHELELLKDKTAAALRAIHEVKLTFGPGSKVRK
jgi:hypothetical protein